MRLEAILIAFVFIAFGFAAVITLVTLTVRAYHREIAQGLRTLAGWAQGVAEWALQFRPRQILAALFGLALLYTLLDSHAFREGLFVLLLAVAVAVGFVVLWSREFLFLMALRDDDLPGRFDKPIWATLLIALPPLGLCLFRTHRLAHWPEPEPKPRVAPAARDLA